MNERVADMIGRDIVLPEVVRQSKAERRDRTMQRTVGSAVSYLCSAAGPLHFGVGAAERVDAIEVTWPGGTTERFPGAASDQLVTVVHGGGSR